MTPRGTSDAENAYWAETNTFMGLRTKEKICCSRTYRNMVDSVKVSTGSINIIHMHLSSEFDQRTAYKRPTALQVMWVGEEHRAFIFALIFGIFNQLSASSSIINYAPLVLEQASHAPLLNPSSTLLNNDAIYRLVYPPKETRC